MGRKINDQILAAFTAGTHFKNGPSLMGSGWARDEVQPVDPYISEPGMLYFLHGTIVARLRFSSNTLELGVAGGAWQTPTTANRIDAFARFYGLPIVRQKNFIWSWTDGVPYTGTRTFSLAGNRP